MALVELCRLPDGVAAQLLAQRLGHDGIHAIAFDTGMNIAEGVGLLIPVRVMVLPEDLADARAALAHYAAEAGTSDGGTLPPGGT